MAKSVMPKSKAKTAYGLLSEIRKLILEEPKRYDQTNVLRVGSDATAKYHSLTPACGTVGCVAGWVCVLTGNQMLTGWDVLDKADEVLGLTDAGIPEMRLFGEERAGSRDNESQSSIRAHAARGAAHIAEFQKKYAAQLKAKRV